MESNLPALTLHRPHNAPLYVTVLSKQQRRIAPEIHIGRKCDAGKGDITNMRDHLATKCIVIIKMRQKNNKIENIPFQQQM